MKLNLDEIYTFKMNSGEEIVARVRSIADDHFCISEPVSVAPSAQGMGLIPALFTATPGTEITVNNRSVAYFGLTDATVKNKYIEATTGIRVAEKKLVLG
jgi:hypothetical protein